MVFFGITPCDFQAVDIIFTQDAKTAIDCQLWMHFRRRREYFGQIRRAKRRQNLRPSVRRVTSEASLPVNYLSSRIPIHFILGISLPHENAVARQNDGEERSVIGEEHTTAGNAIGARRRMRPQLTFQKIDKLRKPANEAQMIRCFCPNDKTARTREQRQMAAISRIT